MKGWKRFKTFTPGQRFGSWTIIAAGPRNVGNHVMWMARCSCGTERLVYMPNLESGKSRSCGCLRKEMMRAKMRLAHSIIGEAVKAASEAS